MQGIVVQVVPALVTKFQTVLAGQGTGARDIPVLFPGGQVDVLDEFAAVAFNGPDGDRPGVAGQMKRSPMGNLAVDEDAIINCVLSAASGDSTPATLYTQVAGWFDLICVALMTDSHLGGVVPAPGLVEVGPYSWYPSDEGGSSMTVIFGVHVIGWHQ